MTTYSIRGFRAKISEILRGLGEGEEIIITWRGKLVSIQPETDAKPSLSTLRGALTHLPDANYEDFLDIKAMWEPCLSEPKPPQDNYEG